MYVLLFPFKDRNWRLWIVFTYPKKDPGFEPKPDSKAIPNYTGKNKNKINHNKI